MTQKEWSELLTKEQAQRRTLRRLFERLLEGEYDAKDYEWLDFAASELDAVLAGTDEEAEELMEFFKL